VKYAVITACAGEFAVAFMCRVLGVAPSGYYEWRARPVSDRARRDEVLTTHVRAAFTASKCRYGSPRVHAELHSRHGIGRKRVARLMRAAGLWARTRRRYVVTTQSKHKLPIAANIVARNFDVAKPNQVWVADLTYLRTSSGFVYLAVILDLFSRRVVGWKVSRDLDASVGLDALARAFAIRRAPAGLLHHSDRGVHYACGAYRKLLDANGATCSMSRKGDCWDNAVAESFFSTLHFELERDARWHTVRDVERDLVGYIDGFYNTKRRHSHNRYLSPVDFERRFRQLELAA
jgi:putative transposase